MVLSCRLPFERLPSSEVARPRDARMMFKNLTGYEIDTLTQCYDLTDGHAFRRWFAAEEAIIDRTTQLFKNNNRRLQVERDYTPDFSRLSNPWTKTPWDISCASPPMALVGEGLEFPQ